MVPTLGRGGWEVEMMRAGRLLLLPRRASVRIRSKWSGRYLNCGAAGSAPQWADSAAAAHLWQFNYSGTLSASTKVRIVCESGGQKLFLNSDIFGKKGLYSWGQVGSDDNGLLAWNVWPHGGCADGYASSTASATQNQNQEPRCVKCAAGTYDESRFFPTPCKACKAGPCPATLQISVFGGEFSGVPGTFKNTNKVEVCPVF